MVLGLIRFLEMLFYLTDGNFRGNQKQKPMDQEDFPLSGLASYFADTKSFKRFEEFLDQGKQGYKEVSYARVHDVVKFNSESCGP